MAVMAVSLVGCDGQESAKVKSASPAPLATPAEEADLRAARDEMIRVQVQLDSARNRNYELQQHVDDLEQQMTKFDKKGLAAKIAELQYRNAGLAKDIGEMKKQLAKIRAANLN
jgi:predicted  nucleic acid-binding Zn-ribbon protein